MVATPQHPWTVASLAKRARLSRSAFAHRFRAVCGTPPERWLTRHRLRAAAWMLLTGNDNLGTIAPRVGYAGAFSLSKAFKRVFGYAPSRVRVASIP